MSLPDASTGLGLRRALLDELRAAPEGAFDFLECAPDNWIGVGGRLGEALDELAARHPLSCHGLSLSLGGTRPLDEVFLAKTRRFLDRHHVALYSEHLSSCTDDGHLYDLMPIPFTDEAVAHVAARIRQVQDALGRRIAVENVSYYAAHPQPAGTQAMDEATFVAAVLAEAGCDLLLDVNNVYVNAVNHGYDARAFLARLYRKTPWYASLFAGDVMRQFSREVITSLTAAVRTEHGFTPEELAGLRMPILMVWGRGDRLLPASNLEFYRRHLPPHARIEEPDEMGHCPHMDAPRKLADRITTFAEDLLREHGGRT